MAPSVKNPPEPVPRIVRLEASSFCQLRCPSCPTTTGAIHPAVGSGFLRFDNFRTLIDDNPIDHVELSNYGETLLNPHLLKILEYAASKAVAISISNGVNLNHAKDELLEGLVKYRVRHITCSIDGASPETYRVYRVRGNFDKVIQNIERINHFKHKHLSEFPKLSWQFVVFGHNEHEIPAARQMAAKLSMDFFTKISWDEKFSPIRDKEFVRAQTGELAVTRQEYEQMNGKTYLNAICHQLWDLPQINWDGKNLGCCRNFWGEFGGNAFADGFHACFNHEKMNYARAMLSGRESPRDDIPCSSCEMYHSMRARSDWIKRDGGRTAIGASPRPGVDILALLRQALSFHQAGRLGAAAAVYQEVLAASPNNFDALSLLGLIHYQHGKHEAAIRQIDLALQINSKSARAHFIRGNALYALKCFEEAMASFDRAIGLNPNNTRAVNYRNNALQELKRYSQTMDLTATP
jgi:MoaA/NifB/PqqE/SkfB family radical SAM enzyme